MHFDLVDLKLFVAVVEARSITHGARRANLDMLDVDAVAHVVRHGLGRHSPLEVGHVVELTLDPHVERHFEAEDLTAPLRELARREMIQRLRARRRARARCRRGRSRALATRRQGKQREHERERTRSEHGRVG